MGVKLGCIICSRRSEDGRRLCSKRSCEEKTNSGTARRQRERGLLNPATDTQKATTVVSSTFLELQRCKYHDAAHISCTCIYHRFYSPAQFHPRWAAGQAVVTGAFPSPPPVIAFLCISRIGFARHSHFSVFSCSSIFIKCR